MTIDKDKLYSLSEVVKLQLVPGIKSYPTLRTEVLQDAARPASQRVIDALIIGDGPGRTIRIKGANLQNFVDSRKK